MTAAAKKSWRTGRALAVAGAAALAAAHPGPPARAQPLPPPAQPAPAPAVGAAGPIDVGQLVQANFEQDVQALQAGRTQPEREDAARRLVARQTPDGRRAILAALDVRPPPAAPAGQPVPPSTPLAAARAVPDDPLPPREYVQPLAALLRTAPDYRHTEAAAAALVAIRTQQSIGALTAFVQDPTLPSRLPAVRPMGASPDFRLAEVLVNLVDPPPAVAGRVEPAIRSAAADALAEMTQVTDFHRDARGWRQWRQWWQETEPAARRNPDQFRADLLERARRRRPGAGLTDIDDLVGRLYQLAPAGDGKAAAARRVLDSRDPPVRAAGARLVLADYGVTGRLPDPAGAPGATRGRLREMVRDPSADVRAEVARVLYGLNDRDALPPLLAQLAVEPDADVRVAIAQALARLGDARAVPSLVQLLRDPSLRVATVGAESLAKLGGAHVQPTPGLRDQVAAALVEAMNAPRARDPAGAGGDLRSACAEALVPLRDPRQQPLFLGLLRVDEPARARRAALGGLGLLGDRNVANRVVDWVGAEPDGPARLAAFGALETIGTFPFAESIYRYTQPAVERDDAVRAAAWKTFVALLPTADPRALINWADRLGNDKRYDQQVAVLQGLLAMQTAGGNPQDARDAQDTRARIAELYLEKLTPPQPQKAIPYLRDAIAIWVANGGAEPNIANIETLSGQLVEARLELRQYPEAFAFAREAIERTPGIAFKLIPQILSKAEDLLTNQRLPQEAERLALEAQKLPNFPDRFKPRLQDILRAARPPAPQ